MISTVGFISFSQNFEDYRLWRALGDIKNGCYLDVGAYDPIIDSVSAAFYEAGWRGLNIEPVEKEFKKYSILRSEDLTLKKVVSDQVETIFFHEFPETGLSTADPSIAKDVTAYASKTLSVDSITLDMALSTLPAQEIHWMKIDVEGYETKVLDGWKTNLKRPWIIVLEATIPSSSVRRTFTENQILNDYGYKFCYFDGLNEFYVHDSHSELSERISSPISIFDQVTKATDFVNSILLWELPENRNLNSSPSINSLLDSGVKKLLTAIREPLLATSELFEFSESTIQNSRPYSTVAPEHKIAFLARDRVALQAQLQQYQIELSDLEYVREQAQRESRESQIELTKMRESNLFKKTRQLRAIYFHLLRAREKCIKSPSLLISKLISKCVHYTLATIQKDLRLRAYLLRFLPNSFAIKLRLYVKHRLYQEMIDPALVTQYKIDEILKSNLLRNLTMIWNRK